MNSPLEVISFSPLSKPRVDEERKDVAEVAPKPDVLELREIKREQEVEKL
jgi:hypothetical protein